ncbi:MAG: type II secretion system protein [Gallionella sp.]|nr:type II secretion system protein [Gallionella sp.]
MNTTISDYRRVNGFSLVEMAIVLAIVALLLGGLLPTISGQIEQQRSNETRKQLDEIQQALIGFAITSGRLPCPASSTSNGMESPVGGGNCSNFNNGFVPAATLGLTPIDSQGFAIDSWNNRIHYAVTSWNSNTFTTTNSMSTVGISNLLPNLLVCSIASTSSSSCSVAGSALTSSPGVPVVIYSTGKNGGYGGTGTDEAENPNPNSADNDRVFVSHVPSPSTATNGEFDDLVVWISPNILLSRMVAAGKLP